MRAKSVSSGSTGGVGGGANLSKTRTSSSISIGSTKNRSEIKRRSVNTNFKVKGSKIDLADTSKKISSSGGLTNYIKEGAKSKLKKLKDDAQNSFEKKVNNSLAMIENAGTDIINSAKDQLVDYLNSILVIPEPVLLATLKLIASKGGTATYNSCYPLKQIIIKDYLDTVTWMHDEFKLSVTSGKGSQVFEKAPLMGATRTSLYVLSQRKLIDPELSFAENRYKYVKDIVCMCKTNFTKSTMLNAMTAYNLIPSAFGNTGCEEFGKKFNMQRWEIDMFLPERKNGLIWETYPRTMEHVELMKHFMNESIYGKDKLVNPIIYKRIYNNLIVFNPIVSIATNLANDVLKETGLDKIIDICTNPEQLMYLYIRYLKRHNML